MIRYVNIHQKKKKKSHLWGEVALGFQACETWKDAIVADRVPRDIEKSLTRKTGRLQSYIFVESIDRLTGASKEYEKQIAEAKLRGDSRHPLILYNKGKTLMYDNKWYEAKQVLLQYVRHLEVEDKERETKSDFKSKCRKPEEDNSYYYLSYCEEQLQMQNITEDNKAIMSQHPTASIVPDGERKNQYEKKHREWVAKYPPTDLALQSRAGLYIGTDRRGTSPTRATPVTSPTRQTFG